MRCSGEIVTSRRITTLGDRRTTGRPCKCDDVTTASVPLLAHKLQFTVTPWPTITQTLHLSVYISFVVVNGAVTCSGPLNRSLEISRVLALPWACHDQRATFVLVASVRLGARESSDDRFRWVCHIIIISVLFTIPPRLPTPCSRPSWPPAWSAGVDR